MCVAATRVRIFFFFNDTATTEIYTLSLHDALPIYAARPQAHGRSRVHGAGPPTDARRRFEPTAGRRGRDRKSTRLNSSHSQISYAVFCLKKKKKTNNTSTTTTPQQHHDSPFERVAC